MAQPQQTQLRSSPLEREGMAFHDLQAAGMRTCSECGKQFSSGKALGGHKRACLQSKNNLLKPKPATIKMEDIGANEAEEGGGGGDDCRCYVCDQRFITKKSLYGHMRKHPERQWRGIHPPPQQQLLHHLIVSASSTMSNDRNNNDHDHDHENDNDIDDDGGEDERGVAMDLVESLKGWSVKDKRGRKSSTSTDTARPSSNSVSKEEEEVDPVDKEAASNLFFLAQTLHKYHDSGGQSKKRKIDQVGYGVLKIKERRPETDEERDMKQQKKRKLTELEPTTYKFHCPICNKGFDKHQALGGHVASHNNKTKNLVNTMKESSASVEEERQEAAGEGGGVDFDQEESGGGGDDRSSRVNGELGDQHQCNICNKNFPTGQALGGHKRCHWTGPNCPEAISSSSQVTTSTGEVSQTPPRKLLGGLVIDLNDTPQEFYQFYGFPEPSQEPEASGAAGAGSKDDPMR